MSTYFIQLSDTHIVADPNAVFHGVNTYDSLERAILQIGQLSPPPVLVMFTGDLINDADPQSYITFRQLTARLTCPVYFALGNHDVRPLFRQHVLDDASASTAPYYYTFEMGAYRGIVLDSLLEGEVGGYIEPAQLRWLATMLAAEPQRPTVVFVHHPPAATGIAWLDAHAIRNGDALIDVLASHSQVRRLFCGHVHTHLHITVRGVQCTSVPSSCYQFGDMVVTPKVLPNSPPGYGVVSLEPDRVSSRVVYF